MAVFLLINSVGYTVYAHYCNDQLEDASIIAKTESCCEEVPSPETDDMSCCAEKDVHIVIKDHFVKSELSFNAISQPVLFISSDFVSDYFKNNSPFIIHNSPFIIGNSSPPPDLTILNSVFRI